MAYWFHTYYKNKSGPGLVDYHTDHHQKFIVSIQLALKNHPDRYTRKYSAWSSYIDFTNYMLTRDTKKWNYYEVIPGDKIQKPYIDIDSIEAQYPGQDLLHYSNGLIGDLLTYIINGMRDVYQLEVDINRDLRIYTSHSETKCSYHIVFLGFYVNNNQENKQFVQRICSTIPEGHTLHSHLDIGLFSSLQQFRLYNSQKPGSDRPKILFNNGYFGPHCINIQSNIDSTLTQKQQVFAQFNHNFRESCITLVDRGRTYIYDKTAYVPPQSLSPRIDMDSDLQITDEMLNVIKPLLNNKVWNISKIDGNRIDLRRLQPSLCKVCPPKPGYKQRIHEHENAYITVCPTNGLVRFYCRIDPSKPAVMCTVEHLLKNELSIDLYDEYISPVEEAPAEESLVVHNSENITLPNPYGSSIYNILRHVALSS